MNVKSKLLINLLVISFIFTACQDQAETKQVTTISTTVMEKTDQEEKVLRHVVIFKFNDESSEEDVERLNQAFNALANAIPVVKGFEWGINDSPENLHQDFTHCYLLTFASEKDRDSVYTPHPQHQAFVQSLQPHLEKVFVVDYWTNP